MSANILDFAADVVYDLIAADTTLQVVRVFTEQHTNTKPQVYPYCAGITYDKVNEQGRSTGMGIATCGVLATQYLPNDAQRTGAAAVAAGELISKIQHKLWDVDCDAIAMHTDARWRCRVVSVAYQANDGHFDKNDNMIRLGFNVSLTLSVAKI